jgi:cyanoexosortase A
MAFLLGHSTRLIKLPKLLLFASWAGLAIIHLSLILRNESSYTNHQNSSFIAAWAAVGYFVWHKRDRQAFISRPLPSLLGAILIAIVLLKSGSLSHYSRFLDYSPLISAIGLGLLSAGWLGLKQYWREFLILGFPALLTLVVDRLIDLSPLTAELSMGLLMAFGFPVVKEGLVIFYQSGAVVVGPGCAGLTVIWQLLELVLIYLLMFPSRRMYWVVLPIAASLISLIINSVRVALLAILSALPTKAVFDYWHEGDGSMIFSLISVALLAVLCHFWISKEEEVMDSGATSNE